MLMCFVFWFLVESVATVASPMPQRREARPIQTINNLRPGGELFTTTRALQPANTVGDERALCTLQSRHVTL
jgi:hypothetical protein